MVDSICSPKSSAPRSTSCVVMLVLGLLIISGNDNLFEELLI